jgi:glucokinase
MKALALDMGGTHIGCGLVEDRSLLAQMSIACEDTGGLEALFPAIMSAVESVLEQAGAKLGDCAGLVLGFPGIVDTRSGLIRSTLDKYPDARSLDLQAWVGREFGLPLRVENDARLALMGEAYAGAGQDIGNLVIMTLGTGIGTAALIEGHLLRGVRAHAGNLGGHMTVALHGRKCLCGNIGCAEAEASGWALPGIVRESRGYAGSTLASLQNITFRDLFLHAGRGDAVALAVRDRCLEVWAANAVALVHAYDPEVLILGGGVMGSAGSILPYIQRHVDAHTWSGFGKVQVRAATLGNSAALFGAIPLLTEDLYAKNS